MADTSHRLLLVRHGQTEWSAAGRHTGRTDVELDAVGRAQADALAWLALEPFALVLTSPLRRAVDTAARAGFPSALPDDDLREWDYGEYEGRTTDAIRARAPEWTIWSGDPPGGETIAAVAERARRVLERLRGVPGDVLLFGHGHALRVLTACALGLEPHAGRSFALDPAGVGELGHERETPVVRRWNLTGTLLA
ncbi:MAG: histidine phosphatase family protein [Acidimicrobiia bacterium]